LPPKLDTDEVKVENSEECEVTDILIYNSRDSDLHVWVAVEMRIAEHYFALAATSRSTI
jgi:hypothetical protein